MNCRIRSQHLIQTCIGRFSPVMDWCQPVQAKGSSLSPLLSYLNQPSVHICWGFSQETAPEVDARMGIG